MGLIMDINNPLIQPSSPAYQEYLATQQKAAQAAAQNTIAAMQEQNKPKPAAVDPYAPQKGFYTYTPHTLSDQSGLWDVYTDAWKKIKGYRDEQGVIDYLKAQPAGTKLKQLSRWEHAPETQHQRQTYVNYFLDNDGNLMYQLEKPNYILKQDEGNGLLGGIASVLTGGLSDIVQGKPFGSGSADLMEGVLGDSFVGNTVGNLLNPVAYMNRDIGRIWEQGGPAIDVLSKTFNRMADPTNTVDYSLGEFGQVLPEDVRNAMPAVLSAIGTVIYPVAGTALGYGIGAGLRGDSATEKLLGAGTAATAAYVGDAAGGLVSNLDTFGNSMALAGGGTNVPVSAATQAISGTGGAVASSGAGGSGGMETVGWNDILGGAYDTGKGFLSEYGSDILKLGSKLALKGLAPTAASLIAQPSGGGYSPSVAQPQSLAQTITNATYPQAQATPSQLPLEGYSKFDRALTPYNLRKRRKLIEDELYPYIA